MNKMKALMLAGGLGVTALTAFISYGGPIDNSVKSVTLVENPTEAFHGSTSQENPKQSSDKWLIQKVWEHGPGGEATVILGCGTAVILVPTFLLCAVLWYKQV